MDRNGPCRYGRARQRHCPPRQAKRRTLRRHLAPATPSGSRTFTRHNIDSASAATGSDSTWTPQRCKSSAFFRATWPTAANLRRRHGPASVVRGTSKAAFPARRPPEGAVQVTGENHVRNLICLRQGGTRTGAAQNRNKMRRGRLIRPADPRADRDSRGAAG